MADQDFAAAIRHLAAVVSRGHEAMAALLRAARDAKVGDDGR